MHAPLADVTNTLLLLPLLSTLASASGALLGPAVGRGSRQVMAPPLLLALQQSSSAARPAPVAICQLSSPPAPTTNPQPPIAVHITCCWRCSSLLKAGGLWGGRAKGSTSSSVLLS